jgi:hypothetical protein
MALELLLTRPNIRLLMGGSGFGGKSYALRFIAIWLACWFVKQGCPPGRKGVFSCLSYESLRDRHASEFGHEYGLFGEVKEGDKKFGNCFKFNDPRLGAICFRGWDKPGSRKGSGYAFGLFDELTETIRAAFGEFCYMVRDPLVPVNPVAAGSNPDGVGHRYCKELWRPHLYREEFDQATGKYRELPSARHQPFPERVDPHGALDPADYVYVPFKPDDNPEFDEARFWANVGHLPEHVQRARRLGLWDTPEGARWPLLDEERTLFDPRKLWHGGVPQSMRRILSVDYGLRAPYCALWHAVDHDGNVYTYREDYKAGFTAPAQVQRIKDATSPDERMDEFRGDPAMWQQLPGHERDTDEVGPSVAQMYEDGFRGDKRFPTFEPGATGRKIHKLATLDKLLGYDNGYPNWLIAQDCHMLWAELLGAVFKQGNGLREQSEELDEKCPDHAIDSAVYGFHQHLTLPRDMTPKVITPEMLAAERERQWTEAENRKIFNPPRRRTVIR